MITSYIVKQNDSLMCGNCRMRLPRLVYTCPFCRGIFSNYKSIMHELCLDVENGKLSIEKVYEMIGEQYVETEATVGVENAQTTPNN